MNEEPGTETASKRRKRAPTSVCAVCGGAIGKRKESSEIEQKRLPDTIWTLARLAYQNSPDVPLATLALLLNVPVATVYHRSHREGWRSKRRLERERKAVVKELVAQILHDTNIRNANEAGARITKTQVSRHLHEAGGMATASGITTYPEYPNYDGTPSCEFTAGTQEPPNEIIPRPEKQRPEPVIKEHNAMKTQEELIKEIVEKDTSNVNTVRDKDTNELSGETSVGVVADEASGKEGEAEGSSGDDGFPPDQKGEKGEGVSSSEGEGTPCDGNGVRNEDSGNKGVVVSVEKSIVARAEELVGDMTVGLARKGDRHRAMMATICEEVLEEVAVMVEGGGAMAVLGASDKLEKIDKMARRNLGLDDKSKGQAAVLGIVLMGSPGSRPEAAFAVPSRGEAKEVERKIPEEDADVIDGDFEVMKDEVS